MHINAIRSDLSGFIGEVQRRQAASDAIIFASQLRKSRSRRANMREWQRSLDDLAAIVGEVADDELRSSIGKQVSMLLTDLANEIISPDAFADPLKIELRKASDAWKQEDE